MTYKIEIDSKAAAELIIRYVKASHITSAAKRTFIIEILNEAFKAGQNTPKDKEE